MLEMRRASDDTIVWSHTVEGFRRKYVGAYYGGERYDGFADLLSQGLHSGMESLANEIRTKQLSYRKGSRLQK